MDTPRPPLPDHPADRARRAVILDELYAAATASKPVNQARFRWEERIGLRGQADVVRQPALGGGAPLPTEEREVDLFLGRRALEGVCSGRDVVLADHGAAIRRAQELWHTPEFLSDVVAVLHEAGFPETVAALLAPELLCDYVEWATGHGVMEPDREAIERARAEAGPLIAEADADPDATARQRKHAQADAIMAAPHLWKPGTPRSLPPCAYMQPCPLRPPVDAPTRILGRPVRCAVELPEGTPLPEALAAITTLEQDAKAEVMRAVDRGRRLPKSDTSYLQARARWYADAEVAPAGATLPVAHIARHYVHPQSTHAHSEYSENCGCAAKVRTGIQEVKRLLGLTAG